MKCQECESSDAVLLKENGRETEYWFCPHFYSYGVGQVNLKKREGSILMNYDTILKTVAKSAIEKVF